MFEFKLKPLRTLNDLEFRLTTYRVPAEGTRQALETKLRAAKKHLVQMQKENAETEVACQAANDRMEAMAAERKAGGSSLDEAADAVAKGTATLDDMAKIQSRLNFIEIAWPKMVEESRSMNHAAMDARYRLREAPSVVRGLESDLILLELTEALAPLSGVLETYFLKSGDAGLLLRPPPKPSETPADTDD